MTSKGIMESVKDKVVVSGTLIATIKGTGAVGTAQTSTVSDVLRGAITGTAQVGGDLGATAKGGVIGVLKGTKDVGVEVVDTVRQARASSSRAPRTWGGHRGRGPERRRRVPSWAPSTSASAPRKPRRWPRRGHQRGRWVPLASAGPSRARTAVARSRKTDPPPLLAPDVLGGLPRLCS